MGHGIRRDANGSVELRPAITLFRSAIDRDWLLGLNRAMRISFPSWRSLWLGGLGLSLAFGIQAEVKLHPMFSDHAVLQRDLAVPIWGTASEGEKVTVEFAGQKRTTTAKNGRWRVDLRPMKASAKGGTLRASGPTNHVDINDVVVGEVWVASGQSNMEWSMAQSFQPETDIAASSNPNLRLFTVTKRRSAEPKLDLDYAPHAWAVASPDTVKRFSAVGYYFGRDLVAALKDVPVGMIHTSWGGSPAEAWMSVAALEADAEYRSKILAPYAESRANWEKSVAAWEKKKADATAKGEKFNEGRPWQPWQPGELYGGMLANIIPFGIRGAIWYQGESNAGRAWQYRRLFADMITNWRRDWGQGDFPFYAVQLAPWDKNRKRDLSVIAAEIGESDWAELREAQNYVAETLPKVGIAVITDVGDKDDIHPTRKGPVGERLARLARDEVYGEAILAYGPRLKSAQFEDEFVQLRFRDAGLGLTTLDGKPPTGFIVAGADKKWYPATATFQGNQTILLRSDSVPRPVAVRYGWNDHPLLNLVNSDDLPASPFRTDNWPVTTQGK